MEVSFILSFFCFCLFLHGHILISTFTPLVVKQNALIYGNNHHTNVQYG